MIEALQCCHCWVGRSAPNLRGAVARSSIRSARCSRWMRHRRRVLLIEGPVTLPGAAVPTGGGHPGRSAIDGRTTRHEGYAKSINAGRGIEKVFGWTKEFSGLRKFKLRGTDKVGAVYPFGEASGYDRHVIAYKDPAGEAQVMTLSADPTRHGDRPPAGTSPVAGPAPEGSRPPPYPDASGSPHRERMTPPSCTDHLPLSLDGIGAEPIFHPIPCGGGCTPTRWWDAQGVGVPPAPHRS